MLLAVLYYGGGFVASIGGVFKLWGMFENRSRLELAGTIAVVVGYAAFIASFLFFGAWDVC